MTRRTKWFHRCSRRGAPDLQRRSGPVSCGDLSFVRGGSAARDGRASSRCLSRVAQDIIRVMLSTMAASSGAEPRREPGWPFIATVFLVPEPSKPLRKLGFLTIGLFDGDDPAPGPRVHAPGDRARRAARLRQRLGAAPASAVRHLLAGRRAGRRLPAHPPDRAGHGGHPAGLGEPAAAGRGPGDRRPAVRRPAQPGHQRRAADALGRREGRALPGHRRASRTSATSGSSGCCGWSAASRPATFEGTVGHRGVLRPGRSRTPPAWPAGSGTAAPACARPSGRASTG